VQTADGLVLEKKETPNRVPCTFYTREGVVPKKGAMLLAPEDYMSAEFPKGASDKWPLMTARSVYYKDSKSLIFSPQILHGLGGWAFVEGFAERVICRFAEKCPTYEYAMPEILKGRVDLSQNEEGLFPGPDTRPDAGNPVYQDILTGLPKGSMRRALWCMCSLVPSAVRTFSSFLFTQPMMIEKSKATLIKEARALSAKDADAETKGEDVNVRPTAIMMQQLVGLTVASRLGNLVVQIAGLSVASVMTGSLSLSIFTALYSMKLMNELHAENTTRIVVNLRSQLGKMPGAANNLVDFSAMRLRFKDALYGMNVWFQGLAQSYTHVINRASPDGRIAYNQCLDGIDSTKLWFISLMVSNSNALAAVLTSWNYRKESELKNLPESLVVYPPQKPAGIREAENGGPSLAPVGLATMLRTGPLRKSGAEPHPSEGMALETNYSLFGLPFIHLMGALKGYKQQFSKDAYALPLMSACPRVFSFARVGRAGDEASSPHLMVLAAGALLSAAGMMLAVSKLAQCVDGLLPYPTVLEAISGLTQKVLPLFEEMNASVRFEL
jgi:hypothetical protein